MANAQSLEVFLSKSQRKKRTYTVHVRMKVTSHYIMQSGVETTCRTDIIIFFYLSLNLMIVTDSPISNLISKLFVFL